MGDFGAGNGHQILFYEKFAQWRQLIAGFLHRTLFRLVRCHFRETVDDARARRKFPASLGQCRLIAFQIRPANGFQFVERDFDALGLAHHRCKFIGAQCIAVLGRRNRTDMAGQILHRGGRRRSRNIKLPLEIGVFYLGKGRLGITGEIICKTAKAGLPIFEIGFGQRQLQIFLDLRGGRRNSIGIFDKRLHPRFGVGIGPRDIHIGVERPDIIGGISMRRVRGFQPE